MKKVMSFLLVLVAVVLLTGCGSGKTLTCTNTEEQNGASMKQTVEMKFKKDKVTNVKMTLETKAVDSSVKEQWSTVSSMLESMYGNTKDVDGIKVTTKNDDKNFNYTVTVAIDVKKAKEEDLAEYDMTGSLDSEVTYEDMKKDAEASGFTCK